MKGILISIDGPNGVGKTTLVNLVKENLVEQNLELIHTKEVTNSSIGKLIRTELDQLGAEALACLIASDRYNHIDKVIKPALEQDKLVITERYYPSSIVYQTLDGCSIDFVKSINSRVLIPDLAIIVRSEEDRIQSRLKERETIDRFERDNLTKGNKEVKLYNEIDQVLSEQGWNVEAVENTEGRLEECAKKITQLIIKSCRNR